MYKTVSPHGWDFGEAISAPWRASRRGLIGMDKQAMASRSSDEIIEYFSGFDLQPGDYPMHQIALGATEAYGPNRNGDGFKEASLRRTHNRFVKFAHPYRNHKNKKAKGDDFYGFVKAAAYNEEMRRVELLTILNGTKEAAARNGGKVADQEIQAVERDGDYPVSMGCSIDEDICSFCKNAAATKAYYCTADTCGAGGCRDNLAKMMKIGSDYHHLHVDNPDPTFFDISKVWKPADRIAYGADASYFEKAASFEFDEAEPGPMTVVVDSMKRTHNFTPRQEQQLKLAYYLADQENYPSGYSTYNYNASVRTDWPQYGSDESDRFLAAMAEDGSILSPQQFAKYSGVAAAGVRRIFSLAMEGDALADTIAANPHKLATVTHTPIDGFTTKHAALQARRDFNLLPEPLQYRQTEWHMGARLNEKTAADDSVCTDKKFAIEYSRYKVAAVQRFSEVCDDADLLRLLVQVSCDQHR